jgi:mRNA-degrading endonuclease toxin of MazEF toxin-antitoxin module
MQVTSPPYPAPLQRGHLYWAQTPYLPERPLDVLRRLSRGEVRAALTFKTRPILVVQNRRDNTNPVYPFVLVAAVHSIKPGELAKLRRINHPTDLLLSPDECGLKRPSVVFLNQLLTIHKNLLQDYIGSLPASRLAELDVKLALALDLIA